MENPIVRSVAHSSKSVIHSFSPSASSSGGGIYPARTWPSFRRAWMMTAWPVARATLSSLLRRLLGGGYFGGRRRQLAVDRVHRADPFLRFHAVCDDHLLYLVGHDRAETRDQPEGERVIDRVLVAGGQNGVGSESPRGEGGRCLQLHCAGGLAGWHREKI